jgi:glycogen debranching enzyme
MTSKTVDGPMPAPGDDNASNARSAWAERAPDVREPLLVKSVLTVQAPAIAICAEDGQIRPVGADGFASLHGYYEHDRRLLSRSELTVDDVVPEYLNHRLIGPGESKHVSMVRTRQDPTPDPVIVVERCHRAGHGESIVIRSHDAVRGTLPVELRVSADLADVSEVRRGLPGNHARLAAVQHGSGSARWRAADDETTIRLVTTPRAEITVADGGSSLILRWKAELAENKEWRVDIRVSTTRVPPTRVPLSAATRDYWKRPAATGDERLDRLVAQGLDDLRALLLVGGPSPRDVFLAAGAPWYLTLFGRDSLWAARLLLPADREFAVASGTLRVLASLQGEGDDPRTDEQYGKILHELRRRTTVHQQGEVLPPVYYGSIDATALFVVLLTEACRDGLVLDPKDGLFDAARRAVEWMRARSEEDRSWGFIRHSTSLHGGLFNHGWKDSVDAVLDKDGGKARGPIALAEVQAYAHQAAIGFAGLLDKCPGGESRYEADELRDWAEVLRTRFVEQFVIDDGPDGVPYFAMALDGDDEQVPGLASNMGHLLGSGLLTPQHCGWIAHHLTGSQLNSGWGLRTRGDQHPKYSPFSYHGGAVWAHDTAIAIRGLSLAAVEADAAGESDVARDCADAARSLADGLLEAGKAFGYRLPELHCGGPRALGDVAPLPFPAACRPQAWSAAAGIAVHASRALVQGL